MRDERGYQKRCSGMFDQLLSHDSRGMDLSAVLCSARAIVTRCASCFTTASRTVVGTGQIRSIGFLYS
ncbi:MAG: hypothetical protein ABJC09_05090 [Terriglobia bacterium]